MSSSARSTATTPSTAEKASDCVRDLGARQGHGYPHLIVVDVVGIRVEFGELPASLPAQSQQFPQHAASVLVDDVQPDRPAQPRVELVLNPVESQRADEVQEYHRSGQQQQAGARGHADRGRFPDRRRGGQPVHRATSGDDDPRAQKPDARDDLGRDTRRVQHNRAAGQDVAEAVLTDQQDQCRRRADDGLRAQTRAFALDGAFQADERWSARTRRKARSGVGCSAPRHRTAGRPATSACPSSYPQRVLSSDRHRVDLITCE